MFASGRHSVESGLVGFVSGCLANRELCALFLRWMLLTVSDDLFES